ncbi:MAG: peptidylprolyl isomerase [Acidimicrobiales bacterium]
MPQDSITNGDTVDVHYTGRLDDGEVFDSSAGRDPLTFEVGGGQVIAGFDEAVRGLGVGESRTVRIEPADAYGERRDELIGRVDAAKAPDGLTTGDAVMVGQQQAVVVEVTDSEVVLDANHPLAGKALTFDVEVVAVS